jgi:DNA-binding response OmpR family regulator
MKDLTNTEVRMLYALMERRSMSRSELLQEVWGFPKDFADKAKTRTLDVHVGRLRRKMEGKMQIIARYGIGYTLTGEVK